MAKRLVLLLSIAICLAPALAAQDLLGFGFFSTGLDDGDRADWSIEITDRNSLIVTYTRAGEMEAIGPLTMSEVDGEAIWNLVNRARFERREETARLQGFKEVLFTFITVDDADRRSFILWRSDAVRDRRLRRLVEGIEQLIETYAGTEPELL